MNFSEIKQKAKEQLKTNKSVANKAVAINFAIALICIIIYSLATQLHWIPTPLKAIFYILYFAYAFFLSPVLFIALVTLITQISKQSSSTEENTLTINSYFKNFRLAGKGIGNYWWTYLWTFLWALLSMIPVIIILLVAILITKNNITSSSENLIATILPLILILCFMPIIIYKTLSYCMNIYVLADNNETGVIEAMNISKAITKGHRGELFGFYISFFGWYVLEIITLGIASIWIEPYIKMSVYNFYKELLANYKPETPNTINATETEDTSSL